MTFRTSPTWLACALFLVACGDDDAGTDAGRDARSTDSAVDAPTSDAPGADTADLDASVDAPVPEDAGTDAGPRDPVDPFDGIGTVELVAERHEDVAFRFLEGPHWRDSEARLVFSDLAFGDPGNATIYALTPPSTIEIVRRPSNGANGNATDATGRLTTCAQAARRVVRGLATETLVFDQYMGMRLNAPNDLVFRGDGTWYFTDPGYGSEGDQDLDFRGVFRVTPDGTLIAEYTDADSRRPNGIALSPDESVLYVADTERALVRAFDVAADGTLSGERRFADVSGPDGMAVDETGNVYVTGSAGVEVFHPDGTSWGTIAVDRQPANCAFGGADRRTLYITARQGLYAVTLPVAGL